MKTYLLEWIGGDDGFYCLSKHVGGGAYHAVCTGTYHEILPYLYQNNISFDDIEDRS